jgi:hypothetical protein
MRWNFNDTVVVEFLYDSAGTMKNLHGLLTINLEARVLKYLQGCLVNEIHFTVRK